MDDTNHSRYTIDEYLKLPYTIEIIPDSVEDYSGYVVRVVELPGCMTQIDTLDELDEMLEDAMRGWLGIMLEGGYPIPLPAANRDAQSPS